VTRIAPPGSAPTVQASAATPLLRSDVTGTQTKSTGSTCPLPPLPKSSCARHEIATYGVHDRDDVLVAYSTIYRMGDLALVSQILGHADHLENEIMYLLVQGIVGAEAPYGGYLVYNRYDSGTDGLRFFKDRCGFQRTDVEWAP
jgi:hypothetical protein